jgi:hypothetical protein
MILPENWRERIRGVFDNIQFPSLPPKKVLLAAFLSSLVFANERTRVLIGHHSREILHLPSSPSPYSMDDSFGEKYSGKNSAANEYRNQIRGQQIHDKNHDKFKLGRSGSDYNDFPSFRFDLHGECTALGNAYISGRSEAELWVALEPYLSDKDKTLAALGYAATVSFTSPENFDAALNAVLFSAGFRYLDANALTIAALNDRLPILKMIDYTMHSYLSPEILDQAFAAAALNFNSEAMKFLINIGADPELYIRTYQHPISVLEFLVSEKYGINDKMYPLRSEQKRLHSIQLLLSQTMDRSIILAAFNTAASECDYDVLKLFLGVRSIQKFRAVALLFALEKNDCPADVLRLLGGTPQMDTERIPMSMEMDRYTLKSARFFKLISGQEVTTYAAVDKLNGELVAIEVQPAMYGVKYLEILKKAGMMEGIVDYYGTFPGKNVDEEWKVGELMSMDLLNYNFYRLSNGFVSGENRMYEAKRLVILALLIHKLIICQIALQNKFFRDWLIYENYRLLTTILTSTASKFLKMKMEIQFLNWMTFPGHF